MKSRSVRMQFFGNSAREFNTWTENKYASAARQDITFHTFLNNTQECSIARLDVRYSPLETTLIIEPSTLFSRTAMLDALLAESYRISPNVLTDDPAIRVLFKNSELQRDRLHALVRLLVSQAPTVSQIQGRLFSLLSKGLYPSASSVEHHSSHDQETVAYQGALTAQ